jgi:hypothetical protein
MKERLTKETYHSSAAAAWGDTFVLSPNANIANIQPKG